jgi:hypothetical protein
MGTRESEMDALPEEDVRRVKKAIKALGVAALALAGCEHPQMRKRGESLAIARQLLEKDVADYQTRKMP